MSAASSCPTRRAATRRTLIDSSDEDGDITMTKHESDDEEAFSPEPQSPPRRQTRSRRSVAPVASASTATPRARGRPKRSIAPSEASEILDPETSIMSAATEVAQPIKKSPRNRRSVVKTEPAEDAALPPQFPTPEPTVSPESSLLPSAPLTDITVNAVNTANERPQTATTDDNPAVRPIRPMDTPMQRPMDIVLKSRTMALPPVEETGPKPRIVITYLVLNNFKSYAGRQEVGPFHTSFSSVVGPNGSGKSNVIDSLLFVFGFRASKMRQGKISALIHNSAQHPDLDHCEVAVHFQEVLDQPGGGPPQVIPNSDLVISRKAFKNNSSKYYMNGKDSSYTAVTTLLRERGVDLDHKRFLILQGEVESIALMKSKAGNEHEDGLLEYLEDIIGTSKYKTPIEEAANEVEALNELCVEKSNRVQIVEKEKDSLEDKKNKAIAYVRDENELAMKNAALYQVYMSEFEDNIAVTGEAVLQIQARLDEELAKHQGSEENIKKLEKAYAQGSKEFDAQAKETETIAKEIAKLDQERVKFDEKRKFLVDKRRKLEKTLTNAENNAIEADNTIEECGEEIETRAAEIASLEEQITVEEAELAQIRDALKGKTQAFSDQIAAKQKALEPWNEKINQRQSAIAVAESELNILREKANAGTVALAEMEAKVASIEEGKAAKLEELKACQAEKARLEDEARETEKEYQDLLAQEPRIRTKVSNVRQKADEARSSLARSQTQGNVLTALMRMKESGRIDGFHGRLGNLGTIDKKYDVAISTACASLDNFVTDTVDAGQQCIEYLRKTNLGRANFICLDKLRARDMSPIQTPENAPRLFDLVKPGEDRFRPAFYHALQDTLVADDLAQANRIAYGARRWRVVTLDGELIDKSGTMSGGGSTVKRGLMSSKLVQDTSKEKVAKYEADRDAIEAKFLEFQDYTKELEIRLRTFRDEIPRLDTRMQKINLEIESATRNLADARRRIKELGREHQPSQTDDRRTADLEAEVARLEASVAELREETASAEAEIKTLQDKIMEVGGERLRAQRAKVDALKEEAAAHAEETTSAEVRRAKAQKTRAKLERDHARASAELEAATADLEALEGEVESQDQVVEELRAQVAGAEEELEARKGELRDLKRELDEMTGELNATRAVEIEMRNTLEENQKVLAENTKYLRHWEIKLSKLKLQDIEELTGESPQATPADEEADEEGEAEGEVEAESEDNEGEDGPEDDDDDENEDDADTSASDAEEQNAVQKNQPSRSRSGGGGGSQPLEIPRYTKDELADMSKDKLKGEIAILEEKTENAVDLAVLSEYRRRVEEHALRSSALAAEVSSRDAARRRCDELRRLRLEGFMEGFSAISLRLKEMYQMITMGGNAELELVDSLDPFSEGINFSVMPPKKSWKNIGNLSGGEKTLSSLALVFALHHYRPTPLYVMDEIDAALDFRNVSIVANYIKERTKNAQFIVISLRNNMFELAARLVGVYKVNHMTKSVTIDNKDYIHRRAPPAQSQQQQHQHQGRDRDYTTMLVGPRPFG